MGITILPKSSILLFSLLCVSILSFAQNATIKGVVRDSTTGQGMFSAPVSVSAIDVSVTDTAGNYSLQVKPGTYDLKVTFVGYDEYKRKVTVVAGETLEVNILMQNKNRMLDNVVVSGSPYGKLASQETISIEVLGPSVFKNTNAIDLADAVNKTPGVQIVDGQASIRGGTGFSYGAGSRVMILVDDLPLLSGDMGGAYWKTMPMETAESIEVLKGASSALYGSSALNGVINLRTGWAKPKPVTDVTFYSGITGTPREKYRKWWSDYSQPFFTGAFASHRQRIGRVDLVIGANYHYEKSYLQENDQIRYRATIKTRYIPKKAPMWAMGINGSFNWERSGRFYLWVDGDTNSFRITDGSSDQYYFVNVDPYVEFADNNGNAFSARTRYFRTFRYGSGTTANSISNLAYGDFRYHKVFKKMFTLTVGATTSYGWMSSNLYEGSRFTIMGAGYSQLEFKKGRFNAVVGGRVEYNQVDTAYQSTRPVFRAGLNFKAAKYTFLRASWGQGYRVPTMVERFLDASFAGVGIKPNPTLQAEKGFNVELAVKQGFGFSNFKGFFDFSLFWMENVNMVEYEFRADDGLYFIPINVDRARIAGFEGNITGQGKIGPVTVRTLFGYTYNFPVNLGRNPQFENAGYYLNQMFSKFATPYTLGDTILLKYRNRHIVRLDLEADYRKFTIGTTIFYNSFMESFDDVLYTFHVDDYFAKRANSKGDFIVDLRLAYQMTRQAKISFIVKNATNLGYSTRPGIMNSPISFTLQFRYVLDKN